MSDVREIKRLIDLLEIPSDVRDVIYHAEDRKKIVEDKEKVQCFVVEFDGLYDSVYRSYQEALETAMLILIHLEEKIVKHSLSLPVIHKHRYVEDELKEMEDSWNSLSVVKSFKNKEVV